MEILKEFYELIRPAFPAIITILAVVGVIIIARRILESKISGPSSHPFRRQVLTLIITLAGIIALVIALPIADSTQSQLLGLIGILLSAAIALSATTFIGNAMAGMMLRSVGSFRPGDFIRIDQHFGRVTERGLFRVEIQTEDRDLTTLPNLYLVTNPVKVIRSSGTAVSAEVSLGYDIPHGDIEAALLESAGAAGLEEPFVHVLTLGDFSVTYRVAGILSDVKHLISVRSRLRIKMLDKLHEKGIEIVSPTFMNTRAVSEKKSIIPEMLAAQVKAVVEETLPEEILFDKADQAESIEKLKERQAQLEKEIDQIRETMDTTENDAEKTALTEKTEKLKSRVDRIAEFIKKRKESEK